MIHPLHPARVEACINGAPIPDTKELSTPSPLDRMVRRALESVKLTKAEHELVHRIMGGDDLPMPAHLREKLKEVLCQ